MRGIESADSLTLDPHKWLFQPLEAGCLLVRDGAAHCLQLAGRFQFRCGDGTTTW